MLPISISSKSIFFFPAAQAKNLGVILNKSLSFISHLHQQILLVLYEKCFLILTLSQLLHHASPGWDGKGSPSGVPASTVFYIQSTLHPGDRLSFVKCLGWNMSLPYSPPLRCLVLTLRVNTQDPYMAYMALQSWFLAAFMILPFTIFSFSPAAPAMKASSSFPKGASQAPTSECLV